MSFVPVLRCSAKEIRERMRLTLTDVSKATGIDVSAISRWERGGEATLSLALRLAKFFAMPIETLWSPLEGSK